MYGKKENEIRIKIKWKTKYKPNANKTETKLLKKQRKMASVTPSIHYNLMNL